MINVLDILDLLDQYDREQGIVLEEISVDSVNSDAVDRLNSIADFLDDQHQG
jgi:hypothetical protein